LRDSFGLVPYVFFELFEPVSQITEAFGHKFLIFHGDFSIGDFAGSIIDVIEVVFPV
jgi:hypothetical protein